MKRLNEGAKPPLSAVLQGLSPEAAQLLLQQQAENIPSSFRQQAQRIVRAHRPAGLPEHFQPMNMGLSDWERVQRERQRQRQEAEARERASQQQAEQQRLAQERAEKAEEEQRKRDEVRRGNETCKRLTQVMNSTPLPQIAEQIRQQWQAYQPNVPVTKTAINPEPDVHIFGGDNIEDSSRVSITLSAC